jgi:hypothetical protein
MIGLIFFHPHPDLPHQGGGVLSFLPRRPVLRSPAGAGEGLREGK